MIRVADYLMNRLYEEGVKNIFTVTGRGALFLTDALAKHENLNSVSLHHEQSAAFAAISNAYLSNNIGACLVSTGCASTNTITGVLSAWQDGLPCVIISGQNTLSETTRHTGLKIRTYGQQEADIISLVKPITKYAVMLSDPNKVVYEFEKAISLSKLGRKGPVWIDVPLDIQSMRINPDEQIKYKPSNKSPFKPSKKDIKCLVDSINTAKRPVIMIGSGIKHSSSEKELSQLIEKIRIPLVFTSSAPDIYGAKNKYSIGSVGSMGCTRSGNFALQNSDLIIVLGSRLTSMTTGTDFCKFGRAAKIIVVDIDKEEHSKATINIDRLIISDLRLILKKILENDLNQTQDSWLDKCLHWKNIFPFCEEKHILSKKIDLYYLSHCLSELLPLNSTLITDSGFAEVILPTNIKFGNKQHCVHPFSQGSMGFALPSIVGSYYFDKKRPIFVVVGDGSVMMNLQELETIHYNNIPAKIIIISNNVYAIIKKRQVELFRKRTIGTDPSNGVGCPDFKKVAECFNIKYMKIEKSEDLILGLEKLIKVDGPIICEILGKEDQEYIEISHTRNKDRKIVKRPLEDQFPFIDRGLFLKEMIIEPIDL